MDLLGKSMYIEKCLVTLNAIQLWILKVNRRRKSNKKTQRKPGGLQSVLINNKIRSKSHNLMLRNST